MDILYYRRRAGTLTAVRSSSGATVTITDADGLVLCDARSNDVTATLPSAVGRSGTEFTVKSTNASGGHVTVASSGGTIDGSSTYLMSYRESVVVRSDGTNWQIVASFVG